MGSGACTLPASGSQCDSNIEIIPLFAVAEVNEHILMVTPPPITMQPIIDKTASYVARKGPVGNDRDVVQGRNSMELLKIFLIIFLRFWFYLENIFQT